MELVMNQFGASYYFGVKEDTSITTAAVHIDLFKWSTTVPWAQIPQIYTDAMLNTQVLLHDLQRLKPQIVIIAITIEKILRVLPDTTWGILAKYEKNNTKRMEVVYIYYSKIRIVNVGQILFIQTTPSPNPFGKLKRNEKIELGTKIKELLCD